MSGSNEAHFVSEAVFAFYSPKKDSALGMAACQEAEKIAEIPAKAQDFTSFR
jgi:hypothetical protein